MNVKLAMNFLPGLAMNFLSSLITIPYFKGIIMGFLGSNGLDNRLFPPPIFDKVSAAATV